MRRTIATTALAAGALVACGQLIGLEPPAHDGPDASVPGPPDEVDASEAGRDANARDAGADAADADAGSAIADANDSAVTIDTGAATCELWTPVTSSPAMRIVAAGPKGDVWGVGETVWEQGSPDFSNYELQGTSWAAQQGGGVLVSIAPDTGMPWLVNTGGVVFQFYAQGWRAMFSNPPMSVIAAGPNQELWGIGQTPWAQGSPDNAIYTLSNGSWVQQQGGAIAVTVAPDTGAPWIVNTDGVVFRLDGGGWAATNGGGTLLSWIAAGPHGVLWGIGKTPVAVGSPDKAIYRSTDGATWQLQNGGAIRIAVSPDGVPWIANANGVVSSGSPKGPCP